MSTVASMTGYATADGNTPVGTVTVECRSVNTRFLDLTLRLDEGIRFTEPLVRETIQKRLTRGKVEVRMTLQPNETAMPAQINVAALKRLLAIQEQIQTHNPEADSLTVAEILEIPGVAEAEATDRDAVAASVLEILNRALDALVEARTREGASLAKVLLGYCDTMSATVADIRSKIPEIIAHIEEKLAERLNTALTEKLSEKGSLTKDEVSDRIRQEVTLYAMRLDVDEEMNRLDTHIREARRLLGAGGAVGRKLDFLAQEMNREANTLGSKAAAIEMTNASLSLKITIDQMREQIQNLE